jgi:hypothetical protein
VVKCTIDKWKVCYVLKWNSLNVPPRTIDKKCGNDRLKKKLYPDFWKYFEEAKLKEWF